MKRLVSAFVALLWALPAAAQLPPSQGIAIGLTPVQGGTSNFCLYVTSTGRVGNQACGAGTAANIQVGTTTVGGGVTGRLLYDNAGVLGEFATTISGSAITFPSTVGIPFLQTGTSGPGVTVIQMTSGGSQYGRIQVESTAGTGAWSLAYGPTATSVLGTAALTWNGSGQVSIPTSLALAGATIGTNIFAAAGSSTTTYLDSVGRLLIGTTSATFTSTQRFEVNGGVAGFTNNDSTRPPIFAQNTDATAATIQPGVLIRDASGNNRMGFGVQNDAFTGNIFGGQGLNFYTGSNSFTNQRMSISSTGAVAINNTLAIGGATIGSNALAVTGTTTLSGNLLFSADATYDIGASGATRPRDINMSRNLLLANASQITFGARSQILSTADGNVLLMNSAGTGFTSLILGSAASASFPAWKRSGTNFHARLADDSDYTNVTANSFVVNSRFEGLNATRIGPTSDGYLTVTNQAVTSGFAIDLTTDATVKFRNRGNSADATVYTGVINASGTISNSGNNVQTNGLRFNNGANNRGYFIATSTDGQAQLLADAATNPGVTLDFGTADTLKVLTKAAAATAQLQVGTIVSTGASATTNLNLRSNSNPSSLLEFATSSGSALSNIVLSANVSNADTIWQERNGGNQVLRVTYSGQGIVLGKGSAMATTDVVNFVHLPSMAGTPTGVPTVSGAGQVPVVIDTTNNKICFYNGAWKCAAGT